MERRVRLSHPYRLLRRVVQTFSNFKTFISDARGYIYVLGQQELWIVADQQPATPPDNSLMGIYG